MLSWVKIDEPGPTLESLSNSGLIRGVGWGFGAGSSICFSLLPPPRPRRWGGMYLLFGTPFDEADSNWDTGMAPGYEATDEWRIETEKWQCLAVTVTCPKITNVIYMWKWLTESSTTFSHKYHSVLQLSCASQVLVLCLNYIHTHFCDALDKAYPSKIIAQYSPRSSAEDGDKSSPANRWSRLLPFWLTELLILHLPSIAWMWCHKNAGGKKN